MLMRDRDRRELPGPLADIAAEHRFAVHVLALMEQEARALDENRRPDVLLLHQALHFFVHVLDLVHHPREELIFARMQARTDAATLKIIHGLHEGHRQLSEAGRCLLQQVDGTTPVRGKRRRKALGRELASYCAGMRQHMRVEETEIDEPALNLLTQDDWGRIAAQLAGLPTPICGIDEAPEYRWLLHRYLNNLTLCSIGALPYAWVDHAASVVERSVHTGAALLKLPGQLLGFARLDAAGLRGGRTALQTLERSTLAPSRFPDGADSRSDRTVRRLQTEADLATYGEKGEAAHRRGAVSWQAAAASVMFRATLKPFLGRTGLALKMAERMRHSPDLRFKVPPGYRATPVEGAAFAGRVLRVQGVAPRTRTILYLPGGAFIFPASNGHAKLLAYLIRKCSAEGLMVDYRLAPDHPFPASVEDALAAYRHLLDRGIEPHEIAVAGDSAGAGLALSLLIALRRAGLPMPACGVCLSPFADVSLSSPSHQFNRWRDSLLPGISLDTIRYYTGDAAPDDPLLSPVCGDFHGVPPLLIQASNSEILLDDGLRVARKARSQGVPVDLEVWDSLPHAWHVFSFIPETRVALRRVAAFVTRHFEAQGQ